MAVEAERKYDEVYRKMNMLDGDLEKALFKVRFTNFYSDKKVFIFVRRGLGYNTMDINFLLTLLFTRS